MPDEVLFVGGRRDSITVIAGTVTEDTDNTTFNNTYSDCSLRISGDSNRFKFDLYSETSNALSKVTLSGAGSRLFVHFVFRYGASLGTSNRMFQLVDSDGFPWFGIRGSVNAPGSSNFNIFWNSGTGASPTWTELGTGITIPGGVNAWDVEFTFGSPHSVNVYINGSIWRSGTFTQALFTNVASVEFGGISSGGGQPTLWFSQFIATDNVSTVGSFVRTSRATGIGANVGFTGNHTAVNEVVGTDTTVQSATTAGLRTTHVMSDVSVPPGLEIRAVFHWLRAKNDGNAPNNLRSVLRSGGIDYVTPNMPLINVGYSPVGARYNVDPLGTNWTETVWNNIEAGFESAT